ncbi:MAG: hypothetical protein J5927_06650 [Oscillospiraceae bacterium]|nr:hypothetical protein [Oscillospiraceae bacterium]
MTNMVCLAQNGAETVSAADSEEALLTLLDQNHNAAGTVICGECAEPGRKQAEVWLFFALDSSALKGYSIGNFQKTTGDTYEQPLFCRILLLYCFQTVRVICGAKTVERNAIYAAQVTPVQLFLWKRRRKNT